MITDRIRHLHSELDIMVFLSFDKIIIIIIILCVCCYTLYTVYFINISHVQRIWKQKSLRWRLLYIFCFSSFLIVGVKRVTWPPEHEYIARAASITRQSPALQPQVSKSNDTPTRIFLCVYFWLRERRDFSSTRSATTLRFYILYGVCEFYKIHVYHTVQAAFNAIGNAFSTREKRRRKKKQNHVYIVIFVVGFVFF